MSTTKNIAKEQVLQVIDGGKGTENIIVKMEA